MKTPGREYDLSTREWLRQALEVSPDAFALHQVIRDETGCFGDLASPPAGAALPQLEAFATRVLDTISDSAAVLDGQLRVRAANQSFLRLFRVDAAHARSRPLLDLVPGSGHEPQLAEYLRARGGEPHAPLVLDHLCPVTGRHQFVHHAWPIREAELTLFVTRDATTPDASRPGADFRAELLSASEGIVAVDVRGVIVFANQGACRLFGYTQDELEGLGVDQLIPAAKRAEHARRRALFSFEGASRPMRGQGDLEAQRKDGQVVRVAITINSVPHAGGGLALCFVTDLDRRRAADERLRDYQEKLRRMTFDAAVAAEQERRRIAVELHDRIGQALAIARLKLTAVGPDVPRPARHAIDDALALIAQCAEDTRSLSFELSPPVLYDLGLGAGLSWLAEDLGRRYGLAVELVDEAPGVPLPEVTAGVLFRTTRELLMNVLKHARTERARVVLLREGDVLQLRVEDRGRGFDAATLERLVGSGFGLFSVREQLSRLGSHLDVQSAPGEGTRITVSTPLSPAQDSAANSSPATRCDQRSSPGNSVSR